MAMSTVMKILMLADTTGGPPGWILPYNPSLDIDLARGRSYVNDVEQDDEGPIKALFSTFSTPAHYATGTDGLLYSVSANSLDAFTLGFKCQGQLIEEARTNFSTNTNLNPSATTNLTKTGDAAATLTVVSDTAALAAIGLSGNVFKLDNSAGSTNARVQASGTIGSTATCTISAYWRGSGTGGLHSGFGTESAAAVPAAYVRRDWQSTSGETGRVFSIFATAGSIVYFILNQIEIGAFVTSPIAIAGSTVTRAASDIRRTLGSELNASGFSMYWRGVVPSNSGVALGQVDDGTNNNRVVVYRHTDNKLYVGIVVGGVEQGPLDLGSVSAGASVRVALRAAENDFAASLNGAAVVTDVSGSLPSGLTTLRPGRDASGAHWNAPVARGGLWSSLLGDAQLRAVAA